MSFQNYSKKYKEVTKQMEDYFEIKPEFRTKINSIIKNRFEEINKFLNNYEIFELHKIIYEAENTKNIENKSLNSYEINQFIDNIIVNKQIQNKKITKNNDQNYSKHKLYKLRALKLKNLK